MERPKSAPSPKDFSLTDEEIASTVDFTSNGFSIFIVVLVMALFGLCATSLISSSNWQQHRMLNIMLCGFTVPILGCGPAMLIAHYICKGLNQASLIYWPKYAQIATYKKTARNYRSELHKYDTWVKECAAIELRKTEEFWRSLTGIGFENELANIFQAMGFLVHKTPSTGDGGVDLVLERDGQRTIVQCKAYSSKVSISTARELVASMIDFKAQSGILAAMSGATKPVQEYVKNKNIKVIDLDDILELQRESQRLRRLET